MRPTFQQTVDVLVKAYLNGTLAHKLCTACAVGNIVAAKMGTRAMVTEGITNTEFDCWDYENGERANWYCAISKTDVLSGNEGDYYLDGLKQIESTGYSIDEIRDIERAFENAPGEPFKEEGLYLGKCTDEQWMFNGLMAVVDVLAEIHGVDLMVKESSKLLFIK